MSYMHTCGWSSLFGKANYKTAVLVPGSLSLALALAFAALCRFATSQGRSGRTLLGEGLWEDLLRKVQHFAKVLNAFVGQGVVVPTPAVDLNQVMSRSEGLQHHHHMEVGDVLQLIVLAGLVVLLHHHHSLFEEMLQDLTTGLLRNQHHDDLLASDRLRGRRKCFLEPNDVVRRDRNSRNWLLSEKQHMPVVKEWNESHATSKVQPKNLLKVQSVAFTSVLRFANFHIFLALVNLKHHHHVYMKSLKLPVASLPQKTPKHVLCLDALLVRVKHDGRR